MSMWGQKYLAVRSWYMPLIPKWPVDAEVWAHVMRDSLSASGTYSREEAALSAFAASSGEQATLSASGTGSGEEAALSASTTGSGKEAALSASAAALASRGSSEV